MTDVVAAITLSPGDYDAVLFDLDGVLTRTANVHAAAWKKLFDDFLRQRASRTGEAFVPFDIATDYPRHVDGKPRAASSCRRAPPATAPNCRPCIR
jgi:beta-phosphoglucomutase-like phosphatase (HAD superfamily)